MSATKKKVRLGTDSAEIRTAYDCLLSHFWFLSLMRNLLGMGNTSKNHHRFWLKLIDSSINAVHC